MTDREKIIDGLKKILNDNPFDSRYDAVQEAIEYLKSQEPIKPQRDGTGLVCGRCKSWIYKTTRFCDYCGQEVKWE